MGGGCKSTSSDLADKSQSGSKSSAASDSDQELKLSMVEIEPGPPVDGSTLKASAVTMEDDLVKDFHQIKISAKKDDNSDYNQFKICTTTEGKTCSPSEADNAIMVLGSEVYPTTLSGVVFGFVRSCVRKNNLIEGRHPCGDWKQSVPYTQKSNTDLVLGKKLLDLFALTNTIRLSCSKITTSYENYLQEAAKTKTPLTPEQQDFTNLVRNSKLLGEDACSEVALNRSLWDQSVADLEKTTSDKKSSSTSAAKGDSSLSPAGIAMITLGVATFVGGTALGVRANVVVRDRTRDFEKNNVLNDRVVSEDSKLTEMKKHLTQEPLTKYNKEELSTILKDVRESIEEINKIAKENSKVGEPLFQNAHKLNNLDITYPEKSSINAALNGLAILENVALYGFTGQNLGAENAIRREVYNREAKKYIILHEENYFVKNKWPQAKKQFDTKIKRLTFASAALLGTAGLMIGLGASGVFLTDSPLEDARLALINDLNSLAAVITNANLNRTRIEKEIGI